MAVLIATEVCKTFGSGLAAVHAIKDVSLRVDEGQLVLLMGPSGSGKTTLLLMCGSLLRPDRGRIFLNEKDISQASDSQLSSLRLTLIGFIFQQFNLLGGLTAIQNVELILNLNGIRGREAPERARLALKLAGLRDRPRALEQRARRIDPVPDDNDVVRAAARLLPLRPRAVSEFERDVVLLPVAHARISSTRVR